MSQKFFKRMALFMSLILFLLSASGCSGLFKISSPEDTQFRNFTNELFKTEISSNTLNLHYTLANPDDFGIENYPVTLGSLSVEGLEQGNASLQNYYDILNQFSYDDLSKSNQVTYDILSLYFENELQAKDLQMFSECLSPTIGTQAQLPVLFAEYPFNTEEDIKNYLTLLSQLDTYYRSIITFYEAKSEKGLFISDTSADHIIEQCKSFINEPQNNYLIETFNEKIDLFDGITKEQKEAYKKNNLNALYDHVIPAYQILINGLQSLKGTGTNSGGISNYPEGASYYEYLLRSNTGIYDSVEEVQNRLNEQLLSDFTMMEQILKNNPDILNQMSTADLEKSEPEDILVSLKKKMKKDFPTPPDTQFQVKYVHPSLEKHLSPAFYLTPPLDKIKDNVIYINPSANYNNLELFTTLAHEGYPGHLYQTTYSSNTKPDNVRNILNFGGYIEGWATYVEMYSYSLTDMDPEIAALLKLNHSMILCLYSNIDIGINYYGWDRKKTLDYLTDFGFPNKDTADSIYDCIVEEPTNYLKYYMGYLKFSDMRDRAETELGDKFNLKDFHEFLLKLGPAQFPIIEKYLDLYIEDKK
jgi:uncharacterized protein (DUF885 family)